MTTTVDWKTLIRDVPDFPKEGIVFKDITPILLDPAAFNQLMDQLESEARKLNPDKIVAPEARGFIFGVPLAARLGIGFVPVRKKGKLPYKTISAAYELEYGTDEIHLHEDAIQSGDKVLIVDDLLATGGTASAIGGLVKSLGAYLCGYLFCIELGFIPGRDKLGTDPAVSLFIIS